MKSSEQIAKAIKAGKIGVMPTDTIYGLVCSAQDKKAVARVYKLKNKPSGFPLIILISSLNDLRVFGIEPSPAAKKILKKIWPNSVSVILDLTDKLFQKKLSYLHGGTNTLSFRMPKEKWLREFLATSGPIVATSANIHMKENATTVEEARTYFEDRVDFYAEGDTLPGPASTILMIGGDDLFLMRQGEFRVPAGLSYRQVIKKKTWPEMFEAVKSGAKKFDLRIADFKAAPGDLLMLMEYDPQKEEYTGRFLKKKIGFVFQFDPAKYPFGNQAEVKKNGLQILSLD